jgi:ABC-type glycerol-3-phosphate transport system permease component
LPRIAKNIPSSNGVRKERFHDDEYHRQEKKVVFHQQTTAEETGRAYLSFLILLVGAVAMLVPFLWMLSTSLKDLSDVFVYPAKFFGKTIVWQNYADVTKRLNFFGNFGNTVLVTIAVLIGQLVTSTMAGLRSLLEIQGARRHLQGVLLAIMIPFMCCWCLRSFFSGICSCSTACGR